jgi:hypothetical protein
MGMEDTWETSSVRWASAYIFDIGIRPTIVFSLIIPSIIGDPLSAALNRLHTAIIGRRVLDEGSVGAI